MTGKIQLFPPKIRGHYQITKGHAIIFRGLFRKCNWKLWRLKNCQCSEITFSSFVSPFRTLETNVWRRPWGYRTFCEADQLIEHFPFNRLSSSLLSALVSTEICCMSKEIYSLSVSRVSRIKLFSVRVLFYIYNYWKNRIIAVESLVNCCWSV